MSTNMDGFHRHYGISKMVIKDSVLGWTNALWIKCLPNKCEDWTSDPYHLH